jgi:hypothetical protein
VIETLIAFLLVGLALVATFAVVLAADVARLNRRLAEVDRCLRLSAGMLGDHERRLVESETHREIEAELARRN